MPQTASSGLPERHVHDPKIYRGLPEFEMQGDYRKARDGGFAARLRSKDARDYFEQARQMNAAQASQQQQ
jgi:hypothetical protein